MVSCDFCLSVTGGVPDAPNATREDNSNFLKWNEPSNNGEPITQYALIVTYVCV